MENRLEKSIYSLVSFIAICFFAVNKILVSNNITAVAAEPVELGVTSTTEETQLSSESTTEDNSKQNTQANSDLAIVEVSNYSLDGGILAAGKDISIILSLHNLSSTYSAESVMLTISSDSGMIYPSYGNDNQFFVGTIPANESVEVAIPITVSSSFTQDFVDLKCQFNYVSNDVQVSNNSSMIITTSGGYRILVKSIDVSTHAIANGKSLISINFSNKSNSNIDDAKLIVEGNVSEESKEIELGTVYAGKSYSKDLNVTFIQTGEQSINVKLDYTDGQGEHVSTNLGKYSVAVSDQIVSENQENEEVQSLIVFGGRVLALIFALIALRVIVLYIKKK